MTRGLRIGLLGGSFNPAHEGHLHISLEALKRLQLDEVWWLVSPGNPLKPSKDMQPFAKRMAAARAITRAHPHIRVKDIEQKLGTRYTVDTVQALQQRFPKIDFVWLMGADNLAQLHRWKRWRKLMAMIPFAIFDRAPFSHTALRAKAAIACAKYRSKFLRGAPSWSYTLMRRHGASSTAIRSKKK